MKAVIKEDEIQAGQRKGKDRRLGGVCNPGPREAQKARLLETRASISLQVNYIICPSSSPSPSVHCITELLPCFIFFLVAALTTFGKAKIIINK